MGISFRSNEDDVQKVSTSIFVTNFPSNFGAKDLWKVCESYGKVVDVFIPDRKSKAGKRFAFVRFIRVVNIDRLVGNLCTIWNGRLHLHANVARFERASKPHRNTGSVLPKGQFNPRSYVSAVNGKVPLNVPRAPTDSIPTLVLDDSCVIERDLSRHVMGRVKEFNSITNLQTILSKEGFPSVKLVYLGGLWVMLELDNVESKLNLLQHVGVNSWFDSLQEAFPDFVSDDRVVWVDIEGIPLHIWSRDTFIKIGSKWGEVMDIEDNFGSSFARKRLCVRTKQPDSILEKFKVILRGKVYMARAKELFTWTPTFLEPKSSDYTSEDESVFGDKIQSDGLKVEGDEESDIEGVPDTIFGDNFDLPKGGHEEVVNQASEDPFHIYDLLNKKPNDTGHVASPSMSHPPGFTPVDSEVREEVRNDEAIPDTGIDKEASPVINSKVMFNSQEVREASFGDSAAQNIGNQHKGGSILVVLEDMIRVGHSMGYNLEGCMKDIERIVMTQGAAEETKMDRISHMDVKSMWGNSNFDFDLSESVGNSGGILCIWEASVFRKDFVTRSDNFIAIYGTWLPCNSKVLIVAVYAPQETSSKRLLWEYLAILLRRWNGEAIIMGDFNAVRSKEERLGSVFNRSCARLFDKFISSSGLVDINLEGYTFTWSHPSASKMSRLDRFLVTEGFFSLFPSISALCLDRHLSDHRPILLREVNTDFGPTPFRFYHSWFSFDGFDKMVEDAWLSFSHSDSNRLVRFKKKLQALKSIIRQWVKDKRLKLYNVKSSLKKVAFEVFRDSIQKSKIQWAIEGDENSKFFHGIVNKKRYIMSIRGVFVDGSWCSDPSSVKDAFKRHFEARFKQPHGERLTLNFNFDKRLCTDQVEDLDRPVSRDEIRKAVWSCGENKSPGPDGFTFEFFRKYWLIVGADFAAAVEQFFDKGILPDGCNSSFIALIPKVPDAKFVTEFRPISLWVCV
ncbi:RNA-directed DNA polymerase, eukaryota [Tanacetum coccineum]